MHNRLLFEAMYNKNSKIKKFLRNHNPKSEDIFCGKHHPTGLRMCPLQRGLWFSVHVLKEVQQGDDCTSHFRQTTKWLNLQVIVSSLWYCVTQGAKCKLTTARHLFYLLRQLTHQTVAGRLTIFHTLLHFCLFVICLVHKCSAQTVQRPPWSWFHAKLILHVRIPFR